MTLDVNNAAKIRTAEEHEFRADFTDDVRNDTGHRINPSTPHKGFQLIYIYILYYIYVYNANSLLFKTLIYPNITDQCERGDYSFL